MVLGDLDVDSDSEAEDDGRAGAMGVARRDARRDGTVPLPPDAVTLRPLDTSELGMAYAWMRRDQRRYNGATKFWDNAAEGIQELFEDPAVPGHPSLREILHPPWPRVVGAFAPALSPAPVGFALFKDDGLTVDAMGVRHGLRRLGIGRHIARALVDRAKIAAPRPRGTARVSRRLRPVRDVVLARVGFRGARRVGLAHHASDATAVRGREHGADSRGGPTDARG